MAAFRKEHPELEERLDMYKHLRQKAQMRYLQVSKSMLSLRQEIPSPEEFMKAMHDLEPESHVGNAPLAGGRGNFREATMQTQAFARVVNSWPSAEQLLAHFTNSN